MPWREQPFTPVSGRTFHKDELARMGQAIERATTIQGPNVQDTGFGSMLIEPDADWIYAKLTSVTGSSPYVYAWTQVFPDGSGGWVIPAESLSGTSTSLPAYEANNVHISTFPVYVKLLRGSDNYVYFYAPASSAGSAGGSGGSTSITVTTVDAGSGDSTASWTTATVNVDLLSGLAVISDAGPVPRLEIQPASATHAGAVNLTTQIFAGAKTFNAGSLTVNSAASGSDSTAFFLSSSGVSNQALVEQAAIWNAASSFSEHWDYLGHNSLTSPAPSWYRFRLDGSGNTTFTISPSGTGSTSAYEVIEGAPGFQTAYTGATGTSGGGDTVKGGIITTLGAAGSATITVGTTTISGGTTGKLLYDNGGVIGEATVGSGLSLSGGTLTASGAGSGDMMATLVNAPVSITISGTTCTASAWNICSFVSGTPTVAAPTGATDVVFGVRNLDSSTASVSVTGITTGATTLQPGASVVYYQDGSAHWKQLFYCPPAANGGATSAPVWTKYVLSYTAFNVAATSDTITVATLDANAVVLGIQYMVTAAFTGVANCLLSLGFSNSAATPSSNTSAYASTIGLASTNPRPVGVSSTALATSGDCENTGTGWNVTATVSGAANLSGLTGGSVTVWVLTMKLPA